MSWNDGYERKKFEVKQKKQAEEYRKLGMTEEQIKAMYKFDLEQYKSDRRFYSRTQSIQVNEFNGEDDEELDNSLMKFFSNELTCAIEDSLCHSRYWWVEEIENSILAQNLKNLSPEYLELLTKHIIDGLRQQELAKIYGISQKNICKKTKKIKNFLSKGV